MITSVEIERFKCFDSLRLSIAPLTLLTGYNGGGKSSAIQPLLILAQGIRAFRTERIYPLNGPLVRLGAVGDVVAAGASRTSGSQLTFKVSGYGSTASWVFFPQAGDRFLKLAARDPETVPDEDMRARNRIVNLVSGLAYVSAVREGAADAYPIPETASTEERDVGTDGRFAPYVYDRWVDSEVDHLRRHPKQPATSMRKQLDAWLGELFPGAQANAQSLAQLSLLSLQFRLSEIGDWRRPSNIGYGLTYAFPILVALLTAHAGEVVIIDSPEAHLHPSAQSHMGRLLAKFAAAGVQILVETHSDHLLNGARLAVKSGALAHDKVAIHFFAGATPGSHGVTSPTIDEEGRIYEWPDGFFDQSEKDLSRLAGWE